MTTTTTTTTTIVTTTTGTSRPKESVLIVYVHGYAPFPSFPLYPYPRAPYLPLPSTTTDFLNRPGRFKGTDVTFEQFPERLQHVVHESRRAAGLDSVVVSKVFPVFETKGELVCFVLPLRVSPGWMSSLLSLLRFFFLLPFSITSFTRLDTHDTHEN